MRSPKRLTLALAGVAGLLTALTISTGPVAAQEGPLTPASYINPDTGKPTENPDVDPGSECETPDQADAQPVVVDPMTDNVHNDACLFDASGERVDTQATFESSGVGTISACPDPDGMDDPDNMVDDKTAMLSDADGDGGNDRCVLSGYEDANDEYHARLISDTAGTQTVTFCEDPEGNGCADADATDVITINWTDDAEPGQPGPTQPGPTQPGPTQPGPTQPGPTQPGPTQPGAPGGAGQVPQGGIDTGVGPAPADDFPLVATIAFGSAALLGAAAVTTLARRRRQWS